MMGGVLHCSLRKERFLELFEERKPFDPEKGSEGRDLLLLLASFNIPITAQHYSSRMIVYSRR